MNTHSGVVARPDTAPPVAELPIAEQLFDQLPDAVYLIDPESSRILWGNRAAWASLGLTREEVLDHSVLSLQMDVVGAPQWADIAAVIRANPSYTFIGRHRHRDGHEVAVEVVTTCFELAGREYFLSVARDVTRRIALDAGVRDRASQLALALNEAVDGLWDWEIATSKVYFSPPLKRMLGYGPDEMPPVLATWKDNIHPEDAPLVERILYDHLEGRLGRYEVEYRLRNRNGHYLWVHDRGKVCERDADGNPVRVVGMVQDISDRKTLELQLFELASHDVLTGLPNRRTGEEFIDTQLALAMRAELPFALCFCDLDHFKTINDVHGHLMGDRVLRRAAQVIAAEVRKCDLAFRWGGEEFVIACPGMRVDRMQALTTRIRRALSAVAWDDEFGIEPITVSIGVAASPEHGTTRTELIASADAALYLAKERGRDRVVLASPVEHRRAG